MPVTQKAGKLYCIIDKELSLVQMCVIEMRITRIRRLLKVADKELDAIIEEISNDEKNDVWYLY